MKRILSIAAACAVLLLLVGCSERGYTPAEPNYEEPGYELPGYEEPDYEPPGDQEPEPEEPGDEPGSEGSPDAPSHNYGIPTPFLGVASIDYTSEEEMAQYPDAPRISWIEEGIWMIFRFEEPVRDVTLVGIAAGFDEAYDFWLFEIGKLIYEAGDLAPGQPFFVQTFGHFGTLPAQAIGFTYTDGIRYYIPFDQSQMDGSLVLHKRAAFTV